MGRVSGLKYLILVGVIFISACIETDIYLPAFPDMMAWFGASEGAIQGLLTWNFVGICVSCPFYGPLSDAFGRKKPLMIALGMFLLGSLITIFAQTFDQMLWGRILQGLGSGGCFTLGTAILFDAYQKERAISAFNTLTTAIPIIMALAPLLGGYLNHTFGFRSNFIAIAFFVVVSFAISLFFFDETLPQEKRTPLRVKTIVRDFKQALAHRGLWQLNIMMSMFFGGYISCLSICAVLFVVEFGMSKALFPFVQAAVLAGWVAGSLLLNRVIRKWGVPKVKKVGTTLCLGGGVLLCLITLVAPRDPYLLTLAMTIYAFGGNWVFGLYFPEAMELLPHIKGITASLLNSMRLLFAALIVGVASAFYNSTVYPLAAIIFGIILVMFPLLFFYERQRPKGAMDLNHSNDSRLSPH